MGGAAEVYLRYVRRYFTKRRVSGVLKSPFSAAGIWSLTVLAPHITQIDLRGLEITPHISEITGNSILENGIPRPMLLETGLNTLRRHAGRAA
jgi:hypothetical protein